MDSMGNSINVANNSGKLISFNSGNINDHLEVIDHIERRRCRIKTFEPMAPRTIPTGEFSFPVDNGVSVMAKKLNFPHTMAVYIRNQAGFMIDELTKGDFRKFPQDQYSIELSAPIKLYVNIDSEFEIDVTSNEVTISFDDKTKILIGGRSHHERPATTVTTTSDPCDLMEAISYLGSALKTTTCERSYPTLRGHPPGIKAGDDLCIPAVLEKPKTNISIRVPPNYRSIFVVSPLAYYFGADIEPGGVPKIETNDGYSHELINDDYSFEKSVEYILKKCFFLDCVTRTEGYYKVSLHERKEIENKLELDFSSLYDLSLSEQLKTYLDIPYDILYPYIPQWKLTAHIETKFNNIEFLPFLVNDLAVIRSAEETVIERFVPDNKENESQDRCSLMVDEFVRTNPETDLLRGDTKSHGGLRSKKGQSEDTNEFVHITETDARERTWIGKGIPIDASKGMIEAFKNRIHRDLIDENINITVVVNDREMMEEGNTVDEIYQSRDEISFTIDAYQNLTVEELREVLLEETEFLHYIGHIDEMGFECDDGQLDMKEMDRTGVDTFLLNACSSYTQAIELIKSGGIVGIATVKPILNSGAKRVGKTIARLLNLGFPFITALDIAKSESIIGENYVVIGDGQLNLTQSKSGAPSLCDIFVEGNINEVEYRTYPTRKRDLGSITIPYAKNNQDYYLTSGTTGEFSMENNELLQFLSMGEMPIRLNTSLYWSNDNEFINLLT